MVHNAQSLSQQRGPHLALLAVIRCKVVSRACPPNCLLDTPPRLQAHSLSEILLQHRLTLPGTMQMQCHVPFKNVRIADYMMVRLEYSRSMGIWCSLAHLNWCVMQGDCSNAGRGAQHQQGSI